MVPSPTRIFPWQHDAELTLGPELILSDEPF
jgi:hypothetical protein